MGNYLNIASLVELSVGKRKHHCRKGLNSWLDLAGRGNLRHGW